MDISLFNLFRLFFKINLFTFGGGYTIVPIIIEEFSEKRPLIASEEMEDLVALAQSGPGAMAISTSLLTGYRLKGIKGGLVALLGSVLPCFIIISLVTYFYTAFRDNPMVSSFLFAVGGAVSAIMIMTTIKMGRSLFRKKSLISGIFMAVAFVLGHFTPIPSGWIIFTAGVLGILFFNEQEEVK